VRQADATERLRAVLASRSSAELVAWLEDPSLEVARAAIRRLVEIAAGCAALDRSRIKPDAPLVDDLGLDCLARLPASRSPASRRAHRMVGVLATT